MSGGQFKNLITDLFFFLLFCWKSYSNEGKGDFKVQWVQANSLKSAKMKEKLKEKLVSRIFCGVDIDRVNYRKNLWILNGVLIIL